MPIDKVFQTFLSWFGIVAFLIFVYLVLSSKNTTAVLGALSSGNIGEIKALQGR